MAGGDDGDEGEDEVDRTSFSDAGNALIDEEDDERMEAMGDFDSNPAVSTQKGSDTALLLDRSFWCDLHTGRTLSA